MDIYRYMRLWRNWVTDRELVTGLQTLGSDEDIEIARIKDLETITGKKGNLSAQALFMFSSLRGEKGRIKRGKE